MKVIARESHPIHSGHHRSAPPVLLALAASLALSFGPVSAQEAKPKPALKTFDVRLNSQAPAESLRGLKASDLTNKKARLKASLGQAFSGFKAATPNAEATFSSATGGIDLLSSSGGGFLTGPAPGQTGAEIVLAFYEANAALFGLTDEDLAQLHVIGESLSPSGLRMVRIEQRIGGIPVFQSETRVTLTADGSIVRVVGSFAPQATAAAGPREGLISAKQALVSAMASVDLEVDAELMFDVHTNADGSQTEVVANDSDVTHNVPSKLVYFSLSPGVLVPAWSQVSYTAVGGAWYTLVDANSGHLLWRKNIKSNATSEDARFRVYVQADGTTPADSPAPHSPTAVTPGSGTQAAGIAPTIVSMHTAMKATASPNGWIDDGGNTTQGNNVHAYLDRDGTGNNVPDTGANSVLDGNGKPVGNPDANGRDRDFLGTAPRDFETNYLPPPQSGNPEAGQTATGNGAAQNTFRRGAVTHLFYISNWFHDELFDLGFDEAAGNFQLTNFSGQGLGNDRVLAECQDGGGVNNANFATPPDGVSGRMQMFRFTGPTIDRDGSLDAEIVIHELAHGLSNRLVGNGSGLVWDVGGALGEGWSDFYALSLLNRTNADDPDASYAAGAYSTYKLIGGYTDNYAYGIRRFPYSTDNSVNPLTFADIDDTTADLSGGIAISPVGYSASGMEVHNAGELWCLCLWEMRSRLIAQAGGDVPAGNQKALQLVTDALKMTPANPTFLQARDAIIDADAATNGLLNEELIWESFADRGLGYKTYAPQSITIGFQNGHLGVRESFDLPYLDIATVTVDDSIGNNNGVLDPNEPARLVVNLTNPWRGVAKSVAGASATLTSSFPGMSIVTGTSTYGAIAPQATVAGTPFRIRVPAGATAGQSIHFSVEVTSALLGTKTVDFILRVGTPGGAGAPITYTQNVVGGSIPDNNGKGILSPMTITDDFEIMDVNFRVDNLTHTFVNDLSIFLKGPNDYGVDLIALVGLAAADGGSGNNLVNVVIDDSSTNDMMVVPEAQAPYTGTYRPIFNDSTWSNPAVYGYPGDPVGQLSPFNGSSTFGTWTVQAADQFAGDTGTLHAWSIIVTPREFAATPFVDAPEITIESPLGTELTDPVSPPLDFGTVNVGASSVARTFRITNKGTIDLILSTTVQSGDTGDFIVDWSGVDTVLAPEEHTEFTVTFTPTVGGNRSSLFEIYSNDSDEGIFEITFAGFGNTGPVVTLSGNNPLFLAPAASFTDPGATAVDPEDGVILPVITANTVVPTTPGVYEVTWTATDTSSATGQATRTVVVQPGALDKKAPGVAITLPTAKTKTVGATFDITGFVSDNVGLLSFEVRLNGHPLALDAPLAFSPNANIPWSVTGAAAENGPNLIEAEATDFNGRRTKVTRLVTFVNSRPALSGIYPAWISPTGTPANAKTGRIQINVIDSGYFTGAVQISGATAGFRGYLANDGTARFITALGNSTALNGTLNVYQKPKKKNRGKKASAVFLGMLEFQITDPAGFIGKVSDQVPAQIADFDGVKAPYNRTNPVPAGLLNQPVLGTQTRGVYNVAFPSKAQVSPVLPTLFPQGDGYCQVVLKNTGALSLSGYLADGGKYTGTGLLRADHTVALHSSLYGGKGAFGGDLTFLDQPNSEIHGTDCLWIRPAIPASRIYKPGWPEGIRIDPLGTKFAPPASLNFGQGPQHSVNGNAALRFDEGLLASPIQHPVNVDSTTGATATVPAKNPNVNIKLTPANGIYSGKFRHEDGTLTVYRGILLNRGSTRGGFGYFISNGANGQAGGAAMNLLAPPP